MLFFGVYVGKNECVGRMEVGRVAGRKRESARDDKLSKIKVREKSGDQQTSVIELARTE